jgi:nucleoside-diphosphate-sugar epimerase
MVRVLIIGCGDIALRLVKQVGQQRAQFYALNRSPTRIPLLRDAGIRPLAGDLDDRRSLRRIAGMADVVLHFAPPPGEGAVDTRTRNLLAALGHAHPPARMIYISTTGVYGDCAGAWVTETRPLRPDSARARRRVDAEGQLRRWAAQNGTQLSMVRAPGIYAAGRVPEARVRQGLPALLPAEDIYTNHIHADDLARLAWHAVFKGRAQRVYNAVDDSGLKMGDWFDCVADHLGLPRPPRLPRAAVMAAVTPAMRTFLSESRRLSNRRVKEELGFQFRYPTVHTGLFGD